MENKFNALNTYGIGPSEIDVDWNKFLSDLFKIKDDDKGIKKCLLCGKENIPYCNSHTVPQFILNKIAKEGKLKNTQVFNNKELIPDESGINKVQTFFSICRPCDSAVFQDYETEDNYEQEPTQQMLKQIALKNHLSRLYKIKREKTLFKNSIIKIEGSDQSIPEHLKKMFLNNFKTELSNRIVPFTYNLNQIQKLKKAVNYNEEVYKLYYYQKLDYVVPYAMQSNSIICYGFDDVQMCNPFPSKCRAIKDLHICIFPLSKSSIILAFSKKDVQNYDDFFMHLKTLDLFNQLSVLNFLVLAYYEDVFLSDNVNSEIFKNQELQNITQTQPLFFSFDKFSSEKEKIKAQESEFCKKFSINKHSKIPNLLDQEYSI